MLPANLPDILMGSFAFMRRLFFAFMRNLLGAGRDLPDQGQMLVCYISRANRTKHISLLGQFSVNLRWVGLKVAAGRSLPTAVLVLSWAVRVYRYSDPLGFAV